MAGDVIETPAADDFASYVTTENAREAAGKPDIVDPVAKVEPEKVDKRTREGKKLSIQQEIDAHYATKKNAEREAAAEQTRLDKIRADIADLEARRPARTEPAPVAAVTTDQYKRYMELPDAPKNDGTFKLYDDYVAALGVFIADKRFDEHTARAAVQASSQEQERSFLTRLDEADTKRPGWDKTVSAQFLDPKIAAKPISQLKPGEPGTYKNGIAQVIFTSDDPVGLMQYLTEHEHDPDIQRLSTLPPDQFFRQMGKIEARVTAAHSGPAAPSVVIPSKAKPVIKPVTGAPNVGDADDGDDDLSFEEHFRRENAKDPNINPRASRH